MEENAPEMTLIFFHVSDINVQVGKFVVHLISGLKNDCNIFVE